MQIFVVLLLLVRCPIAARASEQSPLFMGGRESLMNLFFKRGPGFYGVRIAALISGTQATGL